MSRVGESCYRVPVRASPIALGRIGAYWRTRRVRYELGYLVRSFHPVISAVNAAAAIAKVKVLLGDHIGGTDIGEPVRICPRDSHRDGQT